MNQVSKTRDCPSDDIAAYVDGELSLAAASELERHVDACPDCAQGLRDQRQFLSLLSSSLDTPWPDSLPVDFAKRVVSNAESTVAGLRRPNELLTSVCICSALLLFSLFAFGREALVIVSAVGSIGESLFAVGAFVVRAASGLVFSVAVVSRSLASSLEPGILVVLATLLIAAVLAMGSCKRMARRRSI